ncbi:MAG TPA: hypothetical protein VFT22_22650 [Kofleriaceae bacterium]|nr:hypothetical protein [Kofleriaceae bacterium]
MADPQPRRRPRSIEELLVSQRESVPAHCPHCGRDSVDPDHQRVEAALRARIRLLEQAIDDLQAMIAGQS